MTLWVPLWERRGAQPAASWPQHFLSERRQSSGIANTRATIPEFGWKAQCLMSVAAPFLPPVGNDQAVETGEAAREARWRPARAFNISNLSEFLRDSEARLPRHLNFIRTGLRTTRIVFCHAEIGEHESLLHSNQRPPNKILGNQGYSKVAACAFLTRRTSLVWTDTRRQTNAIARSY